MHWHKYPNLKPLIEEYNACAWTVLCVTMNLFALTLILIGPERFLYWESSHHDDTFLPHRSYPYSVFHTMYLIHRGSV